MPGLESVCISDNLPAARVTRLSYPITGWVHRLRPPARFQDKTRPEQQPVEKVRISGEINHQHVNLSKEKASRGDA
jgi:hypothetical protein